MELRSHFDKFLSNIEPSQNQKSQAITGHSTLRERLQNDEDFKKFYVYSFLSGSYGRHTAISPINDVDIIVITSMNHTWDPSLVLSVLERVLKKYYPGKTKRQTRSIGVELSYITMDVVPAITTNGIDDMIKIPDRELKEWKKTNPRKFAKLSSDLNDKNDGNHIPLVKALKEWREVNFPEENKPKSYLLECLVYYYTLEKGIESIPQGVRDFFWYTWRKYEDHNKNESYSPIVWDPAGTWNNVSRGWKFSDFKLFHKKTLSSWLIAHNAIKSTSYSESVEKWRSILGSKFPQSV